MSIIWILQQKLTGVLILALKQENLGTIVFEDTVQDLLKDNSSLTGQF